MSASKSISNIELTAGILEAEQKLASLETLFGTT